MSPNGSLPARCLYLLSVFSIAATLSSCTHPQLVAPSVNDPNAKLVGRVLLAWSYPQQGAATPSGYRIFRDGKEITTLDSTASSYADKTVWPDTKYTYTVAAFDESNQGPLSDLVHVKTAAPPVADARLEGQFILSPVVLSSDLRNVHPGKPLRAYTVAFLPSCKSGSCGGKFTHYYVSVSGDFHATNHGTFKQRQQTYLAQIIAGSMSWCDASGQNVLSTHDSAQYEIHVTAATTDKRGQWAATKIAGTDTEYYPSGSGCLGGNLKLRFEGSLRS
jgi:hypothetical protein